MKVVGTVDSIFTVRKMIEKNAKKTPSLELLLIDLEKVDNKIPSGEE